MASFPSKAIKLTIRRNYYHRYGHAKLHKCLLSTSTNSQDKQSLPSDDLATIVQGPSLLTNTGFSRPSPSLFFLPGLRSLPFWTAPYENGTNKISKSKLQIAFNDPTVSAIVQHLENNYETIRDEYKSSILGIQSPSVTLTDSPHETNFSFKSPLQPDYDLNSKGLEHNQGSESLHDGQWDWHSYIQNGKRSSSFQSHCPKTSKIIDEIGSQHLFANVDDSSGNNPFGFCFFSTLSGKSKIRPHFGPMNLRLRIHLPLIVPCTSFPDRTTTTKKPAETNDRILCGLRVGTQTRQWIPGKAIVLDDSYEHEVWNDTESPRVILLVDIWHPDVKMVERQKISDMFGFAKNKGWINN